MKDIVLFRKWKMGKDKDRVFALFPEIKGRLRGSCVMFDDELNDSEVIYRFALQRSTPTKVSLEMRLLKRRLTRIGFDLEVRSKAPERKK